MSKNLCRLMINLVLCSFFAFASESVFGANEGREVYAVSEENENEKDRTVNDRGQLSAEDGRRLIEIARESIEKRLSGSAEDSTDPGRMPDEFYEKRGTFVTLTMGGSLRGCIGHIIPQESLLEGVKVNAVNAAFRDPRFKPLTSDEWDDVRVEISILTEPRALDYSGPEDLMNKLRPGIDGVIIKKGYHQSTFLPQVWEQLPSKEEFLAHLCLKAGLQSDAWKQGDLEISIYQVQAFEE